MYARKYFIIYLKNKYMSVGAGVIADSSYSKALKIWTFF